MARHSATVTHDLACALDPTVMAVRAGLTLDPWQMDVVRSSNPRVLLRCSRQAGKSTVSAVVAMHAALYEPGSLTLIVSPAQRQSALMLATIRKLYGRLDVPVPSDGESALSLRLANGSQVVALPGKESTLRGYSGVRRLILDEASRIPDELYKAVRPMLATSGGSLLALSTPAGKRGWWYEAWQSDEAWMRVKVTADMCPRIPKEFLDEERRNLGEHFYNQEYMVEFLDATDAVFSTDDIDRAYSADLQPWSL